MGEPEGGVAIDDDLSARLDLLPYTGRGSHKEKGVVIGVQDIGQRDSLSPVPCCTRSAPTVPRQILE